MSRIFALTSGKGGVGKSTLTVGLGLAFSEMGKRVLLIDMDAGLRCLDLMLGVEEKAVFDLSDALETDDREKAVYAVPQKTNLFLIPAPHEAKPIDPDAFGEFVNDLCLDYDILLFDFPAGMDFSLYPCLPNAALFLTVATPDLVSVRDAAAVAARLEKLSCPSRLLINRFDYAVAKRGVFCNIDEVIDGAQLRLGGIVPDDKELARLSAAGNISPKGKAMVAFRRITKRLEGDNVPLPRLKKI